MYECEGYTKHVCMDITEDIENFVSNEVFGDSEYLFIEKGNKGYCSKCKQEYEVKGLDHNEGVICPICNARLIVKLTRYGRKKCMNEACFYYFEKSIIDSDAVVCKGYYVTKDYTIDYKKPKIEYDMNALYVFESKKSTMMKKSWGYDWSVRNSIFDFNQGWLAPKMCYCSFESIEKAIQGTSFQYIPYKRFQGTYSMVKLFQEYSKYPWIEQLIKVGFENIVEDKLRGRNIYNCLNYRGKNIYEILKVSRKDVKEIRKSEEVITPLFLKLYQSQAKDKSALSVTEIKDVENIWGINYIKLNNILRYTTMRKAIKYMEKQYEKYISNYKSKGDVLITWSDYIYDCGLLEMNLELEQVLYPKNVHAAHQNTIEQLIVKTDKDANEKIIKKIDSVNNKYYFEYQGLIIRAAESVEELIEEGKALHHCVATYAKRYARGEISILLIREKDALEKSFYTLEINNKQSIVQVRGKNNCGETENVKEFIKEFRKEKLTKNKSKIRIAS